MRESELIACREQLLMAHEDMNDLRAQLAAKDAVIEKVIAEIREKAEKYREFERVARNAGKNSAMDSSAGKASGLFIAARMIEAVLAAEKAER